MNSVGLKDVYRTKAATMMQARGIPMAGHSLLGENLATYLSHESDGQLLPRWQKKIERDLSRPYTDGAVGERLDQLQNSLLELVEHFPHIPSKIYLSGSFARGRMGANSDLDGCAVIPDADVKPVFDLFDQRVGLEQAASLFPLADTQPSYNRALLMMAAGATVSIDPLQLKKPGLLRETYRQVLNHKPKDRQEVSFLFDRFVSNSWKGLSVADKRQAIEGPSLKTKLTSAAMAAAGTMAAIPLLGAVVRWGANLCVRQQHTPALDS